MKFYMYLIYVLRSTHYESITRIKGGVIYKVKKHPPKGCLSTAHTERQQLLT
jgi:hypothetical protein